MFRLLTIMLLLAGCGASPQPKAANRALEKGEKNGKKSQNKIVAYYIKLNQQVRACKQELRSTTKLIEAEAPQLYSKIALKIELFSADHDDKNLATTSSTAEELNTLKDVLLNLVKDAAVNGNDWASNIKTKCKKLGS